MKRLATLAMMSWYDGEGDGGRVDLRTSWPTETLRVQGIGGGRDLGPFERETGGGDESKDSATAVGLEVVATLSRPLGCSSSGSIMGMLSDTSDKAPSQGRAEAGTSWESRGPQKQSRPWTQITGRGLPPGRLGHVKEPMSART